MSDPNNARVNADTVEEHLRDRRQLALAGEICHRSAAFGRRRINPAAPPADVLAALLGGARHRYVHAWERWTEVCFREGDALVVAGVHAESVTATVFAPDGDARSWLDVVLFRLKPFDAPRESDKGLWVRFANWEGGGVGVRARPVECPDAATILANYPAATRAAFKRLAADAAPWERGRLVLWSGPAGTGKTFALRALLRAWKDRFDVVAIQDPARFAAEPSYYLDLVTRASDDDDGNDAPPRPLLILVEDGADLVLTDSRAALDDRVGMLLNLTDGLLGQGRRDLFLITFNEELEDVDPAFLRPGRCRAAVRFPALSRAEANAWLAAQGLPATAAGDMTLAELYERLHAAKAGPDADDGAPSVSRPAAERIGFRAGSGNGNGNGSEA